MEIEGRERFVYEFGKFMLDPSERTLFANGTPIHLPAKEFETLLLLVENNRKALRKEEMMSKIWQDSFVEEANLAKQISRLRKIFNTDGDEFIETLPKHGYRFSADLRIIAPAVEESVILEKRTIKRVTVAIEDAPEEERALLPVQSAGRRYIKAAVVGLILLIGLGSAWYLWPRASMTGPGIRSIAVLPLAPLSAEENSRILGLGLTDALITKLGSLKKVVVRPTSAVVPFTNDGSDSLSIGKKLNVDAVLEGTIQEADGRLRVNARLIRTDNGVQMWSQTFDESSRGLFALQDALSANIAKALAFELSKSDNDHLARRGTENAEAYEKFLRGRFYQMQNTADGLNRSLDLYQQAVVLDPGFAEAYAGIADSYIILYNFGFRSAEQTIPRAREFANRALQLNPQLSNAHSSLALIQFLADGDWPAAEASLTRAVELNPNNADAYHRHAYFLMRLGRFAESLEKAAKARELNPLSPIVQSGIGLTYLCSRRYAEAIEQLEKTVAENPQFSHAQWFLALSYDDSGDVERAFSANLKALEMDGDKQLSEQLRNKRESAGLDAANRLWFEEWARAGEEKKIAPLLVAMRAASIKDRELTLRWLERSMEQGDTTLGGVRFLAKFDFVRNEPRFQQVVGKLNF